MATVLIVSLTPVIREVVCDLVAQTGHAPEPVAEWGRGRAAEETRAEVLLLDASLPPLTRDAWVSCAADLRAVVVYFASLLGEPQLVAFAAQRNAPFVALPSRPALLSEVLDAALARRDEEQRHVGTAAGAGARSAFHSPEELVSALLMAKARRVIEESVAARQANVHLRGQRDALAAEMGVRREAMRDTIVRYASSLRRSGTSLEHTMMLTRDALARAAAAATADAPSAPPPDALTPGALAPTSDVDRWVLEAFRAA